MATIESLKEQARRHEQKEEWQKALSLYDKAVRKLAADEEPDIGLYNRIGDLQTRLGHADAAARAYEEAVDLYMESGLPNNAIAVCKKILRNQPLRNSAYLRMGQIRAEQGFLVDARQNFLMYAERVQAAGDIDEALRALAEFADLSPEDAEIRLAVAGQMEQHDRVDDAVRLLAEGYRILRRRGHDEEAEAFADKARSLDPEVNLEAPPAPADAGVGDGFETTALSDHFEESAYWEGPDRGEASAAGAPTADAPGDEEDDEAEADRPAEVEEAPATSGDLGRRGGEEAVEEAWEEERVEPAGDAGGWEAEEEEAEPLPLMAFDEEEDDEDAEPLPLLEDEEEEESEPLPFLDEGAAGSEPEPEPAAAEPAEPAPDDLLEEGRRKVVAGDLDGGVATLRRALAAFEDADDSGGALDAARALADAQPDEVDHRQRMVEMAFRANDDQQLLVAYLELARCLGRKGEGTRAQAVFQQVLSIDPDNAEARAALEEEAPTSAPAREVASSEDYVDLGALIFDEEGEKTTRFVVAYEEPSGDEQADFKKMLSQFKEKVSRNLSADDVKAHHDLGTAYKEMGLLDEAVEEFQQALRASSRHLPSYELLGQCFIEQGRFEAAVKTLGRALEGPWEIEDELLGIYYYMARAHESLGNTESAVEFYDRVFSLDINFADVTERLRTLR